jgi:hypothetical protein
VTLAYVLIENIGVRSIVDGAVDGSHVVALLSKVDEASVRVHQGVGGESWTFLLLVTAKSHRDGR